MSETVDLTFETAPDPDKVARLRAGLSEHSRDFVAEPGFRPLAVFARDGDGLLLGGAYGHLNWTWLDVSLLWVAAGHRGRGLGSRILQALERAAREQGCRRAHVETFDYQARELYERHGYRVFAELPDYPPGHRKLFLRKELTA